MIISVEKLKEFITTDVSDTVLQARLEALETSIRQKTHNNFQDRRYRTTASVIDDTLWGDFGGLFSKDDTIMVNEDLVEIIDITGDCITISKSLLPCDKALVTKVVYPKDILMGVVDVMRWMLANPSDKTGVVSETLSRHSISYQSNIEYDESFGCPKQLLAFLNTYKKARF